MKKKEKLCGIVFLFSLSLSAILTNVLGQTTYTCEVKVGDEYIYRITKLDAFWAIGVGVQLGEKMKFNIADITEETDYFIIEADRWNFISKNESFGATIDYSDYRRVYKDPSDNHAYVNFFVFSPVSKYLAEFAEANPDYSSSGNVLTREYYGSIFDPNMVASKMENANSTTVHYIWITTFDSNGVASKMEYANSTTVHYIWITTFDSNGVASKMEYANSTNVRYVLSRSGSSSSIPGYDLPILIGLTVIAGVSIIYIVKKKMLK